MQMLATVDCTKTDIDTWVSLPEVNGVVEVAELILYELHCKVPPLTLIVLTDQDHIEDPLCFRHSLTSS